MVRVYSGHLARSFELSVILLFTPRILCPEFHYYFAFTSPSLWNSTIVTWVLFFVIIHVLPLLIPLTGVVFCFLAHVFSGLLLRLGYATPASITTQVSATFPWSMYGPTARSHSDSRTTISLQTAPHPLTPPALRMRSRGSHTWLFHPTNLGLKQAIK